jgi:hypothetical protein
MSVDGQTWQGRVPYTEDEHSGMSIGIISAYYAMLNR